MSRRFAVRGVEQAYRRLAMFAIELVDAVTLERVSEGVEVVAEGLQRKPIVNFGGVFVWLQEDLSRLQKVAVDPGTLPYERVEREAAELKFPLTVLELPPRVDYPFATGVTGLRGTLIEEQVIPPAQPQPAVKTELRLEWLDDDGNWQIAPTASYSGDNGNFAAVIRLSPADVPLLDSTGALTVRLRARRGANQRRSVDVKLPVGRVADPSDSHRLVFVWDEMQP